MHQLSLEFESKLEPGSTLKSMWEGFSPCLAGHKINSRAEAYILFSRAYKITELARIDESLKELWLNMLNESSFSLCIEGEESKSYQFNTIVQLVNSNKKNFEIHIEEIDPKGELESASVAIHAISLDSLGKSPGSSFFKFLIASPNTLCLLAKESETYIACSYGTYLKVMKLFHLNFLGRRIDYPSVNILERLQKEIYRIQSRFGEVQFLTLCVSAKNEHMIPLYQGLGFLELEFIEKGFQDEPMYFYGKKMDESLTIAPPTYPELKKNLDEARKSSNG